MFLERQTGCQVEEGAALSDQAERQGACLPVVWSASPHPQAPL